ncbi:enoyl-CoA hydratase-related protein [Paractinoplanes lichenicola]|uniref:enoyl-CoA hydratase-related protein n=1 Tax=Paractinoplanes lichenicola TaxID=2802976 RepID=UPI0027DC852F|nr:enoyl-CoA hydratase-related protein [Actinoplanes lichenicola]
MTEAEQAAEPAVLTERRGAVTVLTLNRPEARNAVDSRLATELGEALAAFDADPEARVAVVTGAGEAFCDGADVEAILRGEDLFARGHREWGFAGFTQHTVDKPVLAAVNGPADGGGTEIVFACDLAVVAETATFSLSEVRLGLLAGAGGVIRLARQLPAKLANEMVLTGRPLDAATAYRWGLVNQVVPASEVLEAAVSLAAELAANAPLAVQASKRLLRASWADALSEEELWTASDREFAGLGNSADALEGLRAFAEGRDPIWSGR